MFSSLFHIPHHPCPRTCRSRDVYVRGEMEGFLINSTRKGCYDNCCCLKTTHPIILTLTMDPTTKQDEPPSSSYSVTRHYYYYPADKNMEQSLDIYEPTTPTSHTTSSPSSPRPTIVLVTGSGWLGRHPWIYTMTNWWNSSGAIAMAKLGYRCILVRHRGAFFQIPEMNPYVYVFVSLGIFVAFLSLEMYVWFAIAYSLFLLVTHLWDNLSLHSRAAATFNEMREDVVFALQYIRRDLNETHIVLAGYSSGAHVVSMILDPEMSTWTHLPHIVGILYISGVLSLDSSFMNLITLAMFGKWACNIPSPYTAPRNRGKRGIFPQTTTETSITHIPIDFITLSFFGKWTCKIPKPFGRTRQSTSRRTRYTYEMRVAQPLPPFSLPPHLFIGCRHEIFGLPLLDATFCSQEYSDSLKKNDTCPTKCILLESKPSIRMNHWTILASPQFSQALDEHLPWLWDPTTTSAATPSTTTSLVQTGTDTAIVAPFVDPTTSESL